LERDVERLLSKEREALNTYLSASDEEADEAWMTYLEAVAAREASENAPARYSGWYLDEWHEHEMPD
jgi:hypothetical protein